MICCEDEDADGEEPSELLLLILLLRPMPYLSPSHLAMINTGFHVSAALFPLRKPPLLAVPRFSGWPGWSPEWAQEAVCYDPHLDAPSAASQRSWTQ